MKLYAVRHGQAQHNVEFRYNDDPSSQSDLTPKGRQQAEATAKALASVPINRIYTSELPRAIQTAEIINVHHKVKLTTDPRLNEIKTGFHDRSVLVWLGKRVASRDNHDLKHNDGESLNEAKARIESFIQEIRRGKDDCVLVVAHQHTLQALNTIIKGHDYGKALRQRIGHAELLEFDL